MSDWADEDEHAHDMIVSDMPTPVMQPVVAVEPTPEVTPVEAAEAVDAEQEQVARLDRKLNVVVFNVPQSANWEEVGQFFFDAGVEVLAVQQQKPSIFVVGTSNEANVEKALALHGAEWEGNTLRVQRDRPPRSRGERGRGDRGGRGRGRGRGDRVGRDRQREERDDLDLGAFRRNPPTSTTTTTAAATGERTSPVERKVRSERPRRPRTHRNGDAPKTTTEQEGSRRRPERHVHPSTAQLRRNKKERTQQHTHERTVPKSAYIQQIDETEKAKAVAAVQKKANRFSALVSDSDSDE